MKPQLPKDVEKRIDEQFTHFSGDEYNSACPAMYMEDHVCECQLADYKEFLAQELEQERNKVIEEVEKIINTIHTTNTGAVVLKIGNTYVGGNTIEDLLPEIKTKLAQLSLYSTPSESTQ